MGKGKWQRRSGEFEKVFGAPVTLRALADRLPNPKQSHLRHKKKRRRPEVKSDFPGYLPRVLKAQRHRPLRLGDQRKERVRLVLPHTLPRAVAVLHPAQHHARGGVRDCTKFRLKIAKFHLQIVENLLNFGRKSHLGGEFVLGLGG